MDFPIVNLLSSYQLPAIFLGSFFFGESVILTAAFLASHGVWSVYSVFWLSLAGTIISDSLWFFFGQTFFNSTKLWEKYRDKYQTLLIKIEEITGQKPFLFLCFVKFLYGTRILIILYLSIRKIPYFTFLLFNMIGTTLWLFVIIPIGWLVGRGVAGAGQVFSKTSYILSALVLLIIINKIVTTWLSKKIIKK